MLEGVKKQYRSVQHALDILDDIDVEITAGLHHVYHGLHVHILIQQSAQLVLFVRVNERVSKRFNPITEIENG